MQLRHDLELPRPETFYTKKLDFEVKVDKSVCGSFTRKDGSKFSLQAPTLLAGPLSKISRIHQASLEDISEAALRFYRSGTVRLFSPAEYIDVLFSTRYQWGMAFEENSNHPSSTQLRERFTQRRSGRIPSSLDTAYRFTSSQSYLASRSIAFSSSMLPARAPTSAFEFLLLNLLPPAAATSRH